VIATIAVLAPFGSELFRRRVPAVVLELVGGILVGQDVLGIAESTPVIETLSEIGLCFLFFMAGYEIEFRRIRGHPMNLAVYGWFMSLGLAIVVAAFLVIEGFALSTLLISLALTTTALGTLLPMLGDAGETQTRFGNYVLAIGAAGEFLPIVAIALLLTSDAPLHTALLLVAFVLLAVAAVAVAVRPQPPRVLAVLQRNLHTSSQLPVRVTVLIIVLLVWVASELGLDILLGAFVAGVVVRTGNTTGEAEIIEHKLTAVGFGLLIPIFFVVSGMDFDLDAFIENPSTLLRVPLFLGLFLVVRGVPVLALYRRAMVARDRLAAALLAATGLPLVVAITSIGLDTDRMKPENAAALVGAAILSVLLFPLIGLGLRRRARTEAEAEAAPEPG
jgi:Kef-type K+ transport system membrane component KefB